MTTVDTKSGELLTRFIQIEPRTMDDTRINIDYTFSTYEMYSPKSMSLAVQQQLPWQRGCLGQNCLAWGLQGTEKEGVKGEVFEEGWRLSLSVRGVLVPG